MERRPQRADGVDPALSEERAERARSPEANQEEFEPTLGRQAPKSPPASVWCEVDNASRVWQSLHAEGHELHFEQDEETGRVTITLRDLAGNVLRSLSPSEALDIASSMPGPAGSA